MRGSQNLTALFALIIALSPAVIAKDKSNKEDAGPAGRYKCSAVHGNLNIIQRTDKQLEFDLDAMWIGDVTVGNVNTGSAHGLILLDGDTATYKDADGPYTLQFKFKRSSVDIEYDGKGFGQWKVTPTGHYKRVTSNELNP